MPLIICASSKSFVSGIDYKNFARILKSFVDWNRASFPRTPIAFSVRSILSFVYAFGSDIITSMDLSVYPYSGWNYSFGNL